MDSCDSTGRLRNNTVKVLKKQLFMHVGVYPAVGCMRK